MKLLPYLLSLFSLTTMYSQRDYHFDYEVQYLFKFRDLQLDNVRSYFINSKDNSFFAMKIPGKDATSTLEVIDNNGLIARQNFKTNEFNKSTIFIQSSNAHVLNNPYKYQIKNYDFEKYLDTLIDGKQLKNIRLSSTNSKRTKRKKLGYTVYLIDPNFDFLPMLEFQTAYEIWKNRKNIPDGLVKYCYTYSFKNELVISLKLKELIKRDFKISFSQ